MDTRIILLSDGTGNAASKVWRTNVWRVFQSLDLTGCAACHGTAGGIGQLESARRPQRYLAHDVTLIVPSGLYGRAVVGGMQTVRRTVT
jgi:mono/diheme cytochrome c family protein